MPSVSSSTMWMSALAVAQVQQRAVVGRRLDDHRVAGVDEQLEQERVRLHRAVGDQHLVGLDAVLLGDPRAQRHVADRRAVGRRAAGIVVEGVAARPAQTLHVDDVQRRRPTGEGDRVGHGAQDTRDHISTTAPSRTCSRRSVPIASRNARSCEIADDRARVLAQRGLEHLERREVEVVGRLVEQQQLGARRDHRGDRRARALAGAEAAERAQRGGALEPEVPEQPARLALRHLRVRAHERDRRHVGGQRVRRPAAARPRGPAARRSPPAARACRRAATAAWSCRRRWAR